MLRTSSDSQTNVDDKPPLSPPLRPQPVPLPPVPAGPVSPVGPVGALESLGEPVIVEDPPGLLPPHPLPHPRPRPPPTETEREGETERETLAHRGRDRHAHAHAEVSSQSLSASEEHSSSEEERDVLVLSISSLPYSGHSDYDEPTPTLLYNQPDGAVRDAEFIRAEKLFFATPLTEEYDASVYRSLQAVQRACAADYATLCAPQLAAQGVVFAHGPEEAADDDALLPFSLDALSLWLPLPFRRRLTDTQSEGETDAHTEGLLARSLSVARSLYRGETLSLTQRAHTVSARAPALTHRVAAKPLTALSYNAGEKEAETRTGRSLRAKESHRDNERDAHKDKEHDRQRERERKNDKEKERDSHKERDRDSRRDPHKDRDRSPPPPHGAPPHLRADELFYGALGFGADGDLCLTTHIAERPQTVSQSCVRSVDSLYALRERYVHDSETQQSRGGCLGVLAVVLLFFGGALFCVRAMKARARRAEKERRAQAEKVLCALAADTQLRQSLEEKLGLSVPPPAPHSAHTHTESGEESEWTVWRVARSLLSLFLSLCLSFCIAVSSLILTGVVLRASGAVHVDSEGEIERDAPPALVLFVALSFALAQVLLVRLVVRSLRAQGVCGGESVSPSAPPLLAQSAVVGDRSHNTPTQRSGSDTGRGSGGAWALSRLSASLPLSLSLFRRRDGEAHAHYTPLAGDELDASSHHSAYPTRSLALGEREGEREMIAIGGTYAAVPPHHVTAVYTSVPVVQQHYGGAPAMVAAVPLNSMSFV